MNLTFLTQLAKNFVKQFFCDYGVITLHAPCKIESMDFFEWQSRHSAYNAAAHADIGWLPHLGQLCYLNQFWSMIFVT